MAEFGGISKLDNGSKTSLRTYTRSTSTGQAVTSYFDASFRHPATDARHHDGIGHFIGRVQQKLPVNLGYEAEKRHLDARVQSIGLEFPSPTCVGSPSGLVCGAL